MATYNAAYEASPDGSSDPGEGDDRIREHKTVIRKIIDQEHVMKDQADEGAAVHRKGSARVYYQAAEPTLRPDATTTLGASDDGRLWIDSDTDTLSGVWNGSAFADLSYIGADADFSGDVTIGGDLTVTGDISVDNLTTTTDLTVGGDLDVTGTITGTSSESASVSDLNSEDTLGLRVYEIGDWNMDATPSVLVTASGIEALNIRMITVLIRDDLGTTIYPIGQGGYYAIVDHIIDNSIALTRTETGIFDSTDYNSTSYNRGWITVWYQEVK